MIRNLRRFALLGWLMTGVAAAQGPAKPKSTPTPEPPPTAAPASPAQPSEVFDFSRFGTITVYRPRSAPRDVVLFVSGDGGWNLGVISMAQRLTAKGAVVAGIDIRHYLAELEKAADDCVSPATDLANLSRYLQSKVGIKEYLQPTLVGYSSGATLVYAVLAEAPQGTFKGALSLGFCPDLDLKKTVCKGAGISATPRLNAKGALQGVNFLAAPQLSGKWISLQGEQDQVCPAPATQTFMASVPGAEIVLLPKVGHGYSVEKNWVPQYEAAYERITAAQPGGAKAGGKAGAAPLSDLPLTLIPAAPGADSSWFSIFLSGDGGWVALDKGVAKDLAQHGIPVVGWDSLKYFWVRRTPEGAAQDLDRVVHYYSARLGRSHVLLIGYSQGADTMPFMVNRLPAATRDLVGFTTLLGISDNALWEFHLSSWLGTPAKKGVPTAPELARWSGSPYLCLYGAKDKDAACKQLTGHDGSELEMPGGHHFAKNYTKIADEILRRLPSL